jgi:hypothetical protein
MAATLNFKFVANTTGLKKGVGAAEKQLGGFKKSVGSVRTAMGKAFGGLAVAAGITSITSALVKATKAAQDDAISQKLLAGQLKRTTGATDDQVQSAESVITKLSMMAGIADDKLRPALANAVRGTGSLTEGQNLLAIALDGAAATGKPLDTVLQALIKAHNGNTSALYKLAPQLKVTKGGIDDFATSVEGAAAASASPFDKLNVATGEINESIGKLLLPTVQKFADYFTTTVAPQLQKFFDDLGNPKTDVGKVFDDIKKAVGNVFNDVKDFFALFGGGDAVKGFGTVAKALITALPALLALKGIMYLAATGKSIANLVTAMLAITAGSKGGTAPGVVATGKTPSPLLGVLGGIVGPVLLLSGDTAKDGKTTPQIPQVPNSPLLPGFKTDTKTSSQIPLSAFKTLAALSGSKSTPAHLKLASGGIVMPRPGGTLAQIAEAGKAEAVIPLDRRGNLGGGNTYVININRASLTGEEIVQAIRRFEVSRGRTVTI